MIPQLNLKIFISSVSKNSARILALDESCSPAKLGEPTIRSCLASPRTFVWVSHDHLNVNMFLILLLIFAKCKSSVCADRVCRMRELGTIWLVCDVLHRGFVLECDRGTIH